MVATLSIIHQLVQDFATYINVSVENILDWMEYDGIRHNGI
jgi:DNA-binding transcriptional regulator YiaG